MSVQPLTIDLLEVAGAGIGAYMSVIIVLHFNKHNTFRFKKGNKIN